jgi:hypothetical protein
VKLARTSPPDVLLPGGQVSVIATGPDRSVANRVSSLLESHLLELDKRLSRATGNPQISIDVKILQSEGTQ